MCRGFPFIFGLVWFQRNSATRFFYNSVLSCPILLLSKPIPCVYFYSFDASTCTAIATDTKTKNSLYIHIQNLFTIVECGIFFLISCSMYLFVIKISHSQAPCLCLSFSFSMYSSVQLVQLLLLRYSYSHLLYLTACKQNMLAFYARCSSFAIYAPNRSKCETTKRIRIKVTERGLKVACKRVFLSFYTNVMNLFFFFYFLFQVADRLLFDADFITES